MIKLINYEMIGSEMIGPNLKQTFLTKEWHLSMLFFVELNKTNWMKWSFG